MTPIPHILLPATQILALTLPPFRHRATIFTSLILILAIWSYEDLLPKTEPTDTINNPHSPTTKQLPIDLLLPLLSQWPWYLGTIEKLLFSLPERDYWRLNRRSAEALTLPSWYAKLKWAVALYCSPRGVGWNFRVKGVPRYTGPKSRVGFVLNQLGWLMVCAVGIDAMGIYTREYYHSEGMGREGLTSYSKSWARSAVNAVHGLFTPYFGLNLAYGQIAILCVGLGLDDPENWPPLYGRIQDATTLRRHWNTWWHQCVRKMYTGYSRQLTKALGFTRGSRLSSYSQLYFVFLLSATGHAMVLYGLPPSTPNLTMWDRWWSFWLCFACQAVAIQAEDVVIWCWFRLVSSHHRNSDWKMESKRWQRNVGRLWVIGWTWLISTWMVDPGLKLGTYDTKPLPFPILEPVLDFLGLKTVLSAIIIWDF